MKKYVFDECIGDVGSEKVFDTESEAVEFAKRIWDGLSDSKKERYLKNDMFIPFNVFRVYEIEISDEQLKEYEAGELGLVIGVFWTRDILDMIKPEEMK